MKGGGEGNVSADLLEKGPLSAPLCGKSLKSFVFLQCWWLFVGAGMEGLFFATGPVAPWMRHCVCSRRVRPRWLQAMVGGSSSLVRVYFGAQVAFKIKDQSNLPRIFSSFLSILSTFYQLFYHLFVSTVYQLFISSLSTFLSTVHQLFINFLSTLHQLFINLLTTVYQLVINFYQLFINFVSTLTTFYQVFIQLFSTFYQLCISCMSTFHQHMTNVLLLYLKISKSFLFIDYLLFCCWSIW